MKDWKIWALLIGLYLVVKMCGGCGGGDSYDDGFKPVTWKCEKCGEECTYQYNEEKGIKKGDMPQYGYGKALCPSCYGDYERWKPAVDAARKKFGG